MGFLGLTTQRAAERAADRAAAEVRSSLESPSVPLSDVAAWHSLLGQWFGRAGEIVTPKTALGVPAVWCAVNFLSGSFASLPLQLFTKDGDAKKVDEDDPLYALLHDAPNGEWTSFNWRKYSMQNVLVHGGRAYTFIEKNRAMRVTGLWPLDPDNMVVRRTGGVKTYNYKDGDREIIYKAGEIIDIPFMLEPDGVTHVHPVMRMAGTIGLSMALEKYAERFFANGGVPPLVLTGQLGSPQAMGRASADVEKSVRDANEGGKNVFQVPTGYTLTPVGYDPEKSQMEKARQFQLGDVARMYNLPPVFLQDLTHGTFSNTEQQDLAYVKHTLTTWLEAWEQELNLKLFSGRSKKFVEFNVDGLLRGDFAARMAGYATGIQNAIITPNEARSSENRPKMGKVADQLQIQGATVPLGQNKPPAPPQLSKPPANDNADNKDDAA